MVGTILLESESTGRADMYAASGFLAGDAFLWLEDDDRRVIVVPSFEREPARRDSRATEVWTFEDVGLDDLLRDPALDHHDVDLGLARGAVERFGATRVRVPAWFPVGTADGLRRAGVAVEVVPDLLAARRRRKDGRDLEAVRLAQRITEGSMGVVRDALRRAGPDADGTLHLDGAPLTSERLQASVRRHWAEHGAEGTTPIVAGGPQAAHGHEVGAGPLRAGEPVVVDLFPRHARLRFHADMTRTFVVGRPSAEVAHWHAVCLEALEDARGFLRPGVTGLEAHTRMCDVLRRHGYPSQLHPAAAIPDARPAACTHSLGHGVGLDVHEPPYLGRSGRTPLAPGDVVSIEPGLYREGVGGLRLEDLVVLTADGCETLTDFPLDLAPG